MLESSLAKISHIAKGSFHFENRLNIHCPNKITLLTCEIKSLYANSRHDLSYSAIEYWIENFQNDLSLWRHFNKQIYL